MLFIKFKLILPYLVLTLVIILLKSQIFDLRWYTHLSTDIVGYFDRADYFFNHGNLENYKINEYQPGATIFFILLSLHSLVSDFSIFNYLNTVIYVNIALIFLLGFLYSKYSGLNSIYTLSLILVFSGPLLLFRHELLLMVFIVSSLLFWNLGKQSVTSLLLGITTVIKVFPIILFPLLLIVNLKNKQYTDLFKNTIAYFIGVFIILTFYLNFFNVSFNQVRKGLEFHVPKPVSSESVIGTFASLWSLAKTNKMPNSIPVYGTFGISYENFPGPFWIYNYTWIVPIVFFYIWLIVKLKKINERILVLLFLNTTLIFLISSKAITPQYFFWYILLLPLIGVGIFLKEKKWFIILVLTLIGIILHQYIYPLNFNKWISMYGGNSNLYLFWLYLLRIFTVIATALISFILLRDEISKNK